VHNAWLTGIAEGCRALTSAFLMLKTGNYRYGSVSFYRRLPNHHQQDNSDFSKEARRTWARLLRKIFDVNPLLCSCGAQLRIVSVITQPPIVDRILRHLRSERCQARDPFESHAPPRSAALSRQ
jgi:hypothetical protein